MVALTDAQMRLVIDLGRRIPPEKRDLYLQRLAAMLKLRAGRDGYRDADVLDVAELAVFGLVHGETDAA